ncbi:two-component system phosphate regulon response regulator PhoB [Volucribacter psittacicida]|uniref:Phosphate regulon transcriptional regulatory protein PhoB n=1 Tax=Volucribacter psittacicida TaxID=203482 RepID=A0A4R1G2D8_9PAST|nr:phosphate regulon transcriptional regulator PhoB [Volucribacter psittacicida]TCK01758.1 two-component system phosphate regulon response regulator PhoB [Volucribacter psittacicida]
MATILLVEDEPAIREMISLFLQQKDYQVISACDYQTALNKLTTSLDLILVDWLLPGRSGIQLIRYLKKQPDYQHIPIIMLTARSSEEDCIQGLNAGADDYISKPFSWQILQARIDAVLRRHKHNHDIIKIDDLWLDPQAQRVSYQQKTISLSGTEFKLLHYFMQNPDKVYPRELLLDRIWGNDIYIEDRTVDVYIRRLRKSLAPYGFDGYIQTVRGVGYRFSNKAD